MSAHSIIRSFDHSIIRNTASQHSIIRSFDHSIIRNTASQHSIIRSFDHSIIRKASGFTLVELLVVIGIIGVLTGVLLASFSGSTESARAAQCLSNMKSLANACQTFGMKDKYGQFPTAKSYDWCRVEGGKRKAEVKYYERPGWISWQSSGKYPSTSKVSSEEIGLYCSNDEQVEYALTNSCLWTYVARNRSVYVCPEHVRRCGKSKRPVWSYFMNSYFNTQYKFGQIERADRRLLFGEIPFMPWHSWMPDGDGASDETDAILQFSPSAENKSLPDSAKGNETLGANHRSGRELFAHVAFADGHCEKLRIPYSGGIKSPQIEDSQLKQLTTWLCEGEDVSFKGGKYDKLDN